MTRLAENPISRGAGGFSPRREIRIPIGEDRTGVAREIAAISYGEPGARPKAYLQTALHADELPGMLVLRHLTEDLDDRAARGEIRGEIVVVPVANPIGLAQVEGDYMRGRVERETQRNFNRGFPDLAELARARVAGRLCHGPDENVAFIRAAMADALDAIEPADAFESLQRALLRLACDADIVLDLHADNEALVHLYASEDQRPEAEDLAAEIDARAVLLWDESGGDPFDETCGLPWRKLAASFPDAPIPSACFAATLELRSNNSVSTAYAARDARALMRFLMRRGLVDGEPGATPRLLGKAASLRAMQQLRSPIEGLVDYRRRLGDTVRAGDVVAEIIPPVGAPAFVEAQTDGLLFARHDQTWAWPDKVIGKIAGDVPLAERTGALLTP